MAATQEDLKRIAAEKAAGFLDGVKVLGLGTGSTAAAFVEVVGALVADGRLADLVAVPTSVATARQAQGLGIPLTDLEACPAVDLTVDGADEVSPELDLIKGLGGALTREKIVASVSRKLVIVADQSKLVAGLGERSPLPVEVIAFGWKCVENRLRELGAEPRLRTGEDDRPFETDQGNYILDCCFFGGLDGPRRIARQIDSIPGVVAHGLFLDMADCAVVAGPEGVQVLRRP